MARGEGAAACGAAAAAGAAPGRPDEISDLPGCALEAPAAKNAAAHANPAAVRRKPLRDCTISGSLRSAGAAMHRAAVRILPRTGRAGNTSVVVREAVEAYRTRELAQRLEEAYRAGDAETERINRE